MKLTPAVQPVVSRGMTRTELVRAAEHAFPNPSLIIELMINHLANKPDEPQSSHPPGPNAVHCPACGAELHLHPEEL